MNEMNTNYKNKTVLLYVMYCNHEVNVVRR